MPDIAIYRHQLFVPSEPFISQQASALRRFRPILIGRTRAAAPWDGLESRTLDDLREYRGAVRRAVQVVTRDPRGFVTLLLDRRVALVHAHFGVEGVYALGLAEALGVPLITTFHGFDATTTAAALLRSRKVSWINYALLRRRLARRGDLFLCVSGFVRERVLRLGFPASRTVTHYIGIDAGAIPVQPAAAREPVVLHVARLVEQKGTRRLIEAMTRLGGRHRDVRLVIIGDGPLRRPLRALVGELGLERRVEFLGVQPHERVLEWMGRAAVVAAPSMTVRTGNAEGFGMIALEAAASGTPIVATDHGGLREAVEDGVTGYLVPEGAVEPLAERLAYVLSSPAVVERLGRAARARVEARFDIRRQTAELERLYERCL